MPAGMNRCIAAVVSLIIFAVFSIVYDATYGRCRRKRDSDDDWYVAVYLLVFLTFTVILSLATSIPDTPASCGWQDGTGRRMRRPPTPNACPPAWFSWSPSSSFWSCSTCTPSWTPSSPAAGSSNTDGTADFIWPDTCLTPFLYVSIASFLIISPDILSSIA